MKNIVLIDQELELLKGILATAITNAHRSTPLPIELSASEYLIACDIGNKVFDNN